VGWVATLREAQQDAISYFCDSQPL